MKAVRNVFRLAVVLWAGSLWSVAIWVAPTLFHAQKDRHLAGLLAAQFFSIETYVGIGAAVLALILPGRSRFLWGYFAVALLIVNEWALKPFMNSAHAHGAALALSFGAWHGVAALCYLAACVAVVVLVWNEDFR
ncbi:MAG: DUF4149 domain-containing protein [Steroidobacteraceae bacterium]